MGLRDPAIQRWWVQFGDPLRSLRSERGLTQETFAANAGLDKSFYVEIETGKHSLLLDRVFAIADALEVPMDVLFAPTAADSS